MNDSILIERDTIILVNTKSGIGSTSTIVMKPFRVLTIYEKFYNKWLIAKEPFKNGEMRRIATSWMCVC